MFGFRKVSPEFKSHSSTVRQAIFDAMVLIALHDQEWHPQERTMIIHVGQMLGFKDSQIKSRIEELGGKYRVPNRDEAVGQVWKDIGAAIHNSPNDSKSATVIFDGMIATACYDGKISEEEIDLLKQFGEAIFGMDESQVWDLVESRMQGERENQQNR